MALADITKRLLVALVLIPLFLLILYAGGYFYLAFILIAISLAYHEYLRLLKLQGEKPAYLPGFVGLWVLIVAFYTGNTRTIAVALTAVPTLFLLSFPLCKIRGSDLRSHGASFFGSMYLGVGGGAAYLLRNYGFRESLFFFFLIWTFDTGAYVVGSLGGRKKLASSISPGKTVEGFFGGILWSIALLLLFYFVPFLKFTSISRMLTLVLTVAGTATLGDLAESAIKREAGVKDSSSLLPGHGGALDRLDSIVASSPIYLLLLACFKM